MIRLIKRIGKRINFRTTFTKQVAIPGISVLFLLSIFGGLFPQETEQFLSRIQHFIYDHLSWVYMLVLTLVILFLMVVAFSKKGNIRLGSDDAKPQYSLVSWISMLFSAGVGIGLMYFGIAEPMAHSLNPELSEGLNRAKEAQLDTFFHWGIHGWALYAAVGLIIAYFAYRYKLPLSLRSGLYPLLKDKIGGKWGAFVDTFALCSTFFGIATSLGFGVVQLNAGLVHIGLIPESSFGIQAFLVVSLVSLAILSSLSGVNKGVKMLSELNMGLAVLLLLFVLFLGPTIYLLSAFSEGLGYYFNNIVELTFKTFAFEEAGKSWFLDWTIMYWAWWISWSPFVGLFIARISKGRTIREFILGVLLIPSTFIFLWMTVFGNGAIWLDEHVLLGNLSAMSGNLDGMLFAFFEAFPLSTLLSVLAVLMITVFFVTSADSGILVINGLSSKNRADAPKWQYLFWGGMLVLSSLTLLYSGGLDALQTMTLITALPFGLVILVLLYGFWKALQTDEIYHACEFTYGSRSWGNGDWRQRLNEILTFPYKRDVEKFLWNRVEPAFKELRTALEGKGVETFIYRGRRGKLSVELVIPHDTLRNFRYGVMASPVVVSDNFMEEENTPEVKDSELFIPVTYYADRRSGNDIQYLSKDEIIADVLKEYERFLRIVSDEGNSLIAIDYAGD